MNLPLAPKFGQQLSRSISLVKVNIKLTVSVVEWLRSPPLDQQVDLEGLGSNPGADKLDSGFQLSVKD